MDEPYIVANEDDWEKHRKAILFAACFERYERGDKGGILEAFYQAYAENEPVPAWAIETFGKTYQTIFFGPKKNRSWDYGFGRPFPKGVRPLTASDTVKAFQIYQEIQNLRKMQMAPIDVQLFDEVGERYGVGKTKCAELYYSIVELIRLAVKLAGEGKLPHISNFPGITF